MTMVLPIGAVDWDALLQVVWVSLLTGIGVTATFAVAIYGATRAVDLSRDGRAAEAGLFGIVAVAALLLVGGAVIFGIVAMADK
jgi:hypothetical protein